MGMRTMNNDFLAKSHTMIPGPGQYSQNPSFIKLKPPLYSIGAKLKNAKSMKDINPGPGEYASNFK